jgi:hypothetical protein
MGRRFLPGLLVLALPITGASWGCANRVTLSDAGATGAGGASTGPGTSGSTAPGTSGSTASGTNSGSTTSGTNSGSTSSAGSASGGTGNPCDLGACFKCQDCADAQLCTAQEATCAADAECNAIQQCSLSCHALPCIQDCVAAHPAGEPNFDAIVHCITCSCTHSCTVEAGACP